MPISPRRLGRLFASRSKPKVPLAAVSGAAGGVSVAAAASAGEIASSPPRPPATAAAEGAATAAAGGPGGADADLNDGRVTASRAGSAAAHAPPSGAVFPPPPRTTSAAGAQPDIDDLAPDAAAKASALLARTRAMATAGGASVHRAVRRVSPLGDWGPLSAALVAQQTAQPWSRCVIPVGVGADGALGDGAVGVDGVVCLRIVLSSPVDDDRACEWEGESSSEHDDDIHLGTSDRPAAPSGPLTTPGRFASHSQSRLRDIEVAVLSSTFARDAVVVDSATAVVPASVVAPTPHPSRALAATVARYVMNAPSDGLPR